MTYSQPSFYLEVLIGRKTNPSSSMFFLGENAIVTVDCIGKTLFKAGEINIDAWVIRPGVFKQNDPNAKTKHSKARVYLSADKSKDLLKIKTNIGVGTVKMKLIRYEPNR